MSSFKTTATAVAIFSVMFTGIASAETGDWFVGIEGGAGKSSFEGSSSASAQAASAEAQLQAVAGAKSKDSLNANSGGIRIGKYLNDNVRIYASLESTGYSGKVSVNGSASAALNASELKAELFTPDLPIESDGVLPIEPTDAVTVINAAASTAGKIKVKAKDLGIKNSKSLMANADYIFMKDSTFRPFAGISAGMKRAEISGKTKNGFAYGAQAGVLTQLGAVDLEAGIKYRNSNIEGSYSYAGMVSGAKYSASGKMKDKSTTLTYISASYRF